MKEKMKKVRHEINMNADNIQCTKTGLEGQSMRGAPSRAIQVLKYFVVLDKRQEKIACN